MLGVRMLVAEPCGCSRQMRQGQSQAHSTLGPQHFRPIAHAFMLASLPATQPAHLARRCLSAEAAGAAGAIAHACAAVQVACRLVASAGCGGQVGKVTAPQARRKHLEHQLGVIQALRYVWAYASNQAH